MDKTYSAVGVEKRLKDMGDNTYAEVVYAITGSVSDSVKVESTYWHATAAFGNVLEGHRLEKQTTSVNGIAGAVKWLNESAGKQECTVAPTEPPAAGANVDPESATQALETTQKQLLASSAEVVALLQQQREFASTLWVDKSGASPVYYSRREIFNESNGTFTVVFYDMAGTQVAYQNTFQPVAAAGDVGALSDLMQVLAGDPHYTEGTVLTLLRIVTADGTLHQTWRDGDGAAVNAPTNYEPVSENSSRWISLNTYLSDLKGAGATGVAQPTGGSGMFGWLSGIYKKLSDAVAALTDGTQKTKRVDVSGNVAPAMDTYARAGFVTDRTGWESEVITGRTRDNTKDQVFTYGDGTSETLYFTTAGDYAGKSARA